MNIQTIVLVQKILKKSSLGLYFRIKKDGKKATFFICKLQ